MSASWAPSIVGLPWLAGTLCVYLTLLAGCGPSAPSPSATSAPGVESTAAAATFATEITRRESATATAPPTPEARAVPAVPTASPAEPIASPPSGPTELSPEDAIALVMQRTVYVGTDQGSGTGISLGGGRVLTAAHVVADAEQVAVRFPSGRQGPAQIVAVDPRRDLALLQSDFAGEPAAELDDGAALRPGAALFAVGHPTSRMLGVREPTVTRGIFSALRQDPDGVRYIQTDTPLNPGNSGGPLADARGRVIGVVSFGVRDTVGLNLAVAGDEVQAFLRGPAQPPTRRPLPSPTATPRPTVPAPLPATRARVIKRYGAALRESPDGEARILVTASCNQVLEVLESRGGWRRVSTGAVVGWVGDARIAVGAESGPADCRGAMTFPVGSQVVASVPTGCLSLRSEPSRSAPFEHCVPNGHRLQIVNGPREANGEDWFEVQSPSTGNGWSLAEFLRPTR